jgi:hypothetical protein
VILQCPSTTLSPPWGKSVGGVSERAGAKAGGSNPFATTPSRDVMVKGILVFWKAPLFAGRRRNEDLGRSVFCNGYPPEAGGAPVTADVRRSPRRGTPSRMRHKAHAPTHARTIVPAYGDASFTRSFDPCTLILTHTPAQAVVVGRSSRYHGWENPRKREEPSLGSTRTNVARLAACHCSRKGAAWCVRKGRRSRPSSLRGSKSPGLVIRTSYAVAEVGRRQLAPNKLGKRAPKRAVRVE